jgi:2-oxoglutarate ferredoxin oxidoreductase subunit gamma
VDRRGGVQDLSVGEGEVRILIAGAGGQGILLMGKVLTYALLLEGNQVSWLPSYGAEVRGGTCKCMVVFSNEEVYSPYIFKPDYLIVMNEPSYRKYVKLIEKGKRIFYNSSLIKKEVLNSDLDNIGIEATKIAKDLGDIRIANMVMLGAFISHSGILKAERIYEVLPLFVKDKKLLKLDEEAFRKGLRING